jgi:arginine decarboxylase
MVDLFVPKNYFVVKGSAQDRKSELSAFDKALKQAGIAQCNLVPVSSVLPAGAEEVEHIEIPAGKITFCVLARTDGRANERIGAGLGWAILQSKSGKSYGLVAEYHGADSAGGIKSKLLEELKQMTERRGGKVGEAKTKVESVRIDQNFGCALVALIYVN